MKIQKLEVPNLPILTELFDYKDATEMIRECTRDIRNGNIDIFVLYDKEILIGELRVMYKSEDEYTAIPGKRAYLFAFRVKEDFQNKGYGTYLLKEVLALLKEKGYSEFTVGVEDDNSRAIHMYREMGFTEFLIRKQEEYQGDSYEYNLYLKR